jgi:hypothetical protein
MKENLRAPRQREGAHRAALTSRLETAEALPSGRSSCCALQARKGAIRQALVPVQAAAQAAHQPQRGRQHDRGLRRACCRRAPRAALLQLLLQALPHYCQLQHEGRRVCQSHSRPRMRKLRVCRSTQQRAAGAEADQAHVSVAGARHADAR